MKKLSKIATAQRGKILLTDMLRHFANLVFRAPGPPILRIASLGPFVIRSISYFLRAEQVRSGIAQEQFDCRGNAKFTERPQRPLTACRNEIPGAALRP
jgi:hypothetical protein